MVVVATDLIKTSTGFVPHPSTNARTLAKLDKSSTRTSTLASLSVPIISFLASWAFSILRQARVTFAPNRASLRAHSRPIPTFAVGHAPPRLSLEGGEQDEGLTSGYDDVLSLEVDSRDDEGLVWPTPAKDHVDAEARQRMESDNLAHG